MARDHAKFTVTEKCERSLRSGHVWVYGEEVTAVDGEYENGTVVDVYSQKCKWLGAGFVNDNSKIRVRILSRNPNDKFDREFFRRRLDYAIRYRRQVMGDDFDACRLVFGEADGLPGLTVDRFGDILVTEVLSLGCDKIRDVIYGELVSLLADIGVTVRAIYERSDSPLRDKEGLPRFTGYVYGDGGGHVTIRENGILYDVDYEGGQKTGFFLDQKYNRAAAARIAPGLRVLDCFTHTGAFALNCARAGAASVLAVDISRDALDSARKNASLNGLDGSVEFLECDVFDYLTELSASKSHMFDYIILDPPAFTKSTATVGSAYRGYKDINMRAMKSLPRGGYLATCSCSHFMKVDMFRRMLADAASDAAVSLRQIEARRQSPDHPILWGVPETEYLKFYIFQIV